MYIHELIVEVEKSGMKDEAKEEVMDLLKSLLKKYKVTWSIKLSKTVAAESEEQAKEIIENLDCQRDGEYQEDSFIITKTEEV